MYRPNFYESTCLRCNEIVYQVDRVGPLKDFTFFHSGCFKCVTCGTKLTLKTYYNNQHKQEDKEVCSIFHAEWPTSIWQWYTFFFFPFSFFFLFGWNIHIFHIFHIQSIYRFIAVHMYQKVVPAILIKHLLEFVRHSMRPNQINQSMNKFEVDRETLMVC